MLLESIPVSMVVWVAKCIETAHQTTDKYFSGWDIVVMTNSLINLCCPIQQKNYPFWWASFERWPMWQPCHSPSFSISGHIIIFLDLNEPNPIHWRHYVTMLILKVKRQSISIIQMSASSQGHSLLLTKGMETIQIVTKPHWKVNLSKFKYICEL